MTAQEKKERQRLYMREWSAKNKEYKKIKDRDYTLRRKYGISTETYKRMYEDQSGTCFLCNKPMALLNVDHDHTTGKVRKLLCVGCNIAIGGLETLHKKVTPDKLFAYLQTGKEPQNPYFLDTLAAMRKINAKKAHDYAGEDPFSNFKDTAQVAGITIDQVFRTMLGVKLARLAQLMDNNKAPLNESINDSLLDLATYATLWASYHKVI